MKRNQKPGKRRKPPPIKARPGIEALLSLQLKRVAISESRIYCKRKLIRGTLTAAVCLLVAAGMTGFRAVSVQGNQPDWVLGWISQSLRKAEGFFVNSNSAWSLIQDGRESKELQ